MLTMQVKGAIIQAPGTEVRDGYHLERNKVWQAQTWKMECLFESIELLIDKKWDMSDLSYDNFGSYSKEWHH